MTRTTSGPRGAVLVTGAGRGIGRATAEHLASRGWQVYAGVRDQEAGRALAAAHPTITPVELDITVDAHVEKLDEILPRRLDGVVNNAGIAVGGPIETVHLDDVRRQFDVNVVGQIAVTQAVLPRIRRAKGRVVFISSLNGRISIPMSAVYNASKFALEAVADSLRVELRPWEIGVVLVEPGCIDTDPWREMMSLLDGIADGLDPDQRALYAPHLRGQRKIVRKLQQQTRPAPIVARAVESALTRRRPPSRIVVGADARRLLAMRALLPTRALDRVWAIGMGLT